MTIEPTKTESQALGPVIKPKRTFWQWLRSVRYGEITLWLLFSLTSFGALIQEADPAYMAGLFAIVAIGVRATRPEAKSNS